MPDLELLKNFCHVNRSTILARGSPHAKLLLLPQNDNQREQIKQALLIDPKIGQVIQRPDDPTLGLNSLLKIPADYRLYGSFYWRLRFLADVGLSGEELGIGNLIRLLQIHQLEDGQFMVRYHRKKQQTISLICMTAHLSYCLIRLGYEESNTVTAALNFILTSQRGDGGWHCDRLKQNGERDESAPSCPAANIHVIRLLGQYGKTYEAVTRRSIHQFLNAIDQIAQSGCELEGQQKLNFNKLRYPPHFTGLDILNVIHSLSFFPEAVGHPNFEKLIESLLKRWDGTNWLRAEKRIPKWSGFDFCQKNSYSEWLTSLLIQTIERSYY